MTVYQAVASFVPNDAVSEAARRFRDILEPAGGSPRIIAEGISRQLSREAVDFRSFGAGDSGDVIVYHVSTDSALAAWIADRPEKVVVYYHNLTPSEFIEPYDPEAARRLKRARVQAASLSDLAWRSAAPSHYSLSELDSWGFDSPRLVPFPVASKAVRSDQRLGKSLSSGGRGFDVLFVGRLTPNKCQHDLLRALVALRRQVPEARLFFVGGTHLPLYELYLRRLTDLLGLEDVVFAGSVSPSALAAYYETASVFCSLSRHEGFGVPLVEAMSAGVPVVALDEAAVGETVGDGGVLLPSATPSLVAGVLERVCGDRELRLELVEAGTERARALSDAAVLRHSLTELVTA